MVDKLTAVDLVDGFKLNRATFRQIRLVWKRAETLEEGFLKESQRNIDQYQRLAASPETSSTERDALLTAIESEQAVITGITQQPTQVRLMEFWTNRRDSQIRMADPEALLGADADWRFPAVPLSPTSMLTDYRNVEIWSYNSQASSGRLRHWSGVDKSGRFEGYIASKQLHEAYSGFEFPPLMTVGPAELTHRYWHAIDRFFARPINEIRLVGTVQVEGRTLHVLRHLAKAVRGTTIDRDSRALTLPSEKTRTNLTKVTITDCWIDVERGYLPIKVLSYGDWVDENGGFLCEHIRKPHQVIEVQAIELVPDAGYYPTRGTITDFIFFSDAAVARDPLEYVLAGNNIYANRFKGMVISWDVSEIQALPAIHQQVFALPFPNGTLYYDSDKSRAFLQGGTDQDYENLMDRAVSDARAGLVRAPLRWGRRLLYWLTVVAISILLPAVIWKHRRRLVLIAGACGMAATFGSFACASVGTGTHHDGGQPAAPEFELPPCGVACVRAVCSTLGHRITDEDVFRAIDELHIDAHVHNLSMLQMRQLLNGFGVDAHSIRCNPHRAGDIPTPGIIFLRPIRRDASGNGHYAFLASANQQEVQLFDFSLGSGPIEIPLSQLRQHWHGEMLYVSNAQAGNLPMRPSDRLLLLLFASAERYNRMLCSG